MISYLTSLSTRLFTQTRTGQYNIRHILGTDDIGPATLADPTVALPTLQHYLGTFITLSHYSSPNLAHMCTIQAFHW